MPPDPTPPSALPTAIIGPARNRAGLPAALAWLIPLLALVVASLLVAQSLSSRGPRLTLTFADGYGLRPNDPVVYHGVQVGRVRAVGIAADTQRVRVEIELARDVTFLRRYWIVRPELSLSRVAGLETIVGPRYIAADTGPRAGAASATPQTPLTLDAPPGDTAGDGLYLLVRSTRAASVTPGSPVSYRELPVGAVTAVSLAPDGRTVEISVRINPEHARLVRDNSVFWNVSGIGLDLGIVGGLKLKAESLQTILAGGLAFATPDAAGAPVASGAEFTLGEYDPGCLKWSPDLGAAP